MARGLLRRILAHLPSLGVPPGATICDPFGGIGTTGIEGACAGYRVILCELEEKFVNLATRNFGLHARKWELLGCLLPVCVQGDSRNLRAVLQGAGLADVVLGSPLYAGRGEVLGTHNGIDYSKAKEGGKVKTPAREASGLGYGDTPGNLGNLPPGEIDCVLSSPPYEGTPVAALNPQSASGGQGNAFRRTGKSPRSREVMLNENYSVSLDNLGNTQGATFWEAAHAIVMECYSLLRPGGVMVWVTKAFCRDGRIVDFPGDWQRLCESAGLRAVQVIHASLVKETREKDLFGGEVVTRKKRVSFFRRLHEKKRPDLSIDYEVVHVMRKGGPGE